MSRGQPAPPQVAEGALRAVLSASLAGRSILGDLREEYVQRFKQQGAAKARRWYMREALGIILRRMANRMADRTVRRTGSRQGRSRILADLKADLLYAGRTLAGSPRFAVVAVLTLALGIGSASAIFSVCHAVLLRPLPYPDPQRLVTLWSQEDWSYGTNGPEYFDIRQRQKTLQDIAVYTIAQVSLNAEGVPAEATAAAVSGGFFTILGVPALLGSTFGEAQDAPGKNDVIVLSHGFWQRRFGGDPSAVGQTLSLLGTPVTVIGVMPGGFAFPAEATAAMLEAGATGASVDFWIPLGLDPARAGGRGGHGLRSLARLRPGVSLEQASQDMRRISLQMHQEHPQSYPLQYRSGWTLRLEPLHNSIVTNSRPALLILSGAAGLLLLISCVNVANLLLARAASRRKEIAMRAALGASRGRLVRQLLTESALLSLLGGLLGLVLAIGGLGALLHLAPQNIPRLAEVGIDGRMLAFALAVSALTGVVFGLAPAFLAVRKDLRPSLRQGGADSSAPGRQWGNSLVVAEVALSLLLLIGAGLLTKSLINLLSLDPGFSSQNVLTFQLKLPSREYSRQSSAAFYERLLQRVKALPGVQAAGAISALPLGQDQSFALLAEGMAPNNSEFPHGVISLSGPRNVTPGYFASMGIQLIEGRFFEEADQANALKVSLISDEFARLAWPDEKSFVGKRIAPARRSGLDWFTVVGVTKDVREEAGKLSSQRYKDAYFPLAQLPRRDMAITVKTVVEPTSLIDPIRQAVASLDDSLALYDIRTMQEVLSKAVAQPRFNTLLVAVFAALALILSAVGLFGVLSNSVSRRSREIGIRMALGAGKSSVLYLVIRRGMAMALIGAGLGLGAGLALAGLLQSLLFGISPIDGPTYALVSASLLSVALLACYLPARKAAQVDPIATLR